MILNGRDCYLGKFDSAESRLEFDRLIAEWLAHGRQLPDAVPCGGLSVAELLAACLRFAEHYFSSDGQPASEYTAMNDAVRRLYSRFTVREFGPLALKAALFAADEETILATEGDASEHCRRTGVFGVGHVADVFVAGVRFRSLVLASGCTNCAAKLRR